MFPVLVVMYVKLARTEERQALAEFGDAYVQYQHDVPGFIPRLGRMVHARHHEAGRKGPRRFTLNANRPRDMAQIAKALSGYPEARANKKRRDRPGACLTSPTVSRLFARLAARLFFC